MTALTEISQLAADRRGDALQAREPPGREHYFWIDALRGLAAIIVLISHVSIFGLYGYEHTLATYPPTRLLWAGHQAVILFFVISGFALFLLYESMLKAGESWRKFLLVRFLRLYPPYLASLVLAVIVIKAPSLFGIPPPANMPIIANGNLTPGTVLGHLSMVGEFDRLAINPPIWSLVFEGRLCLLFPLLYLLVARVTWGSAAMTVAAWLAAVGCMAAWELFYAPRLSWALAIIRTIDLASTFLIGAAIAKFRFRIVEWMSARQPSVLAAMLLVSVFVFMYSYGYSWPGWAPRWVQLIAELFTALASASFIAMAISFPAPRKHRVLGFLGKISYSLYLVHQVAIMAVILLFFGRYPAPVLWVISITASLGLASVFYWVVEAPSIAASRAVRRSRQAAVGRD
jgi:peptidoglycan/LPS O-acetylase OafA/YrhL